MKGPLKRTLILLLLVVLGATQLKAQWLTERFELRPGWQAISLRVDSGTAQLGDLLADYPQIEEIWRWRPNALDSRIVSAPDDPSIGVEWQLWKRGDTSLSSLFVLYPNSSYLVKVSNGAPNFTLSIKGEVVSPDIRWRTDGLNLLGFPTHPTSPPTAEAYFSPAELLNQTTEIYGYTGGALSNDVNPGQLIPRHAKVERGKAYWIRSNKYADYDGPLRVRAAIGEGIDFAADRPTVRVILTNRTNRDLEATLSPEMSEAPPGETVVPQIVPLTRRVISDSGEVVFETFDSPHTISVRAGERVGVTLGIDRSQLVGMAGTPAYSLLKVNDSEGLSEFYVPARAEVSSLAGLWVGEVDIMRVQNQLQRFQKDDDGNYLVDDEGNYIPEYKTDVDGVVLTDGDGNPIPDTDTDLNRTAQTYRLKLILHVDASGVTRMLSRVYLGAMAEEEDGSLLIGLSTSESPLLREYIEHASRIFAVHMPRGTNLDLAGDLAVGAQLSGEFGIAHDNRENPFIHTYHPDHDNWDARFENQLSEGIESHRIDRSFTFTVHSEAGEVTDPAWGTTLLTGIYAEVLAGLHKNDIAVEGVFAIRKVSDIDVLIDP